MAFIQFIYHSVIQVNCKLECKYDEESEIDESLNGLPQDDPILVEALKNYYLTSPADQLPYKIDKDRLQPERLDVSTELKEFLAPQCIIVKILH